MSFLQPYLLAQIRNVVPNIKHGFQKLPFSQANSVSMWMCKGVCVVRVYPFLLLF